MKALDIDLNNILTKHTKFVKKNNEYFINDIRVLISIPGDKYLTMFVKNRHFKIEKKQFFNALKFICFINKTNEFQVKPVDCTYQLTLHIYNSNWINNKTLVDFKERVSFVHIPKQMTIISNTNKVQDEYKGGFIWSKLDSSQKPQENTYHNMDCGGFSGGYNPFYK